ncbi:beta-1,4-N-acetylglucosamine oligosaccharide 3-O-carbamoyltransferase NolO [Actinocorallia herbida]|uniref:Beta-1,4-N-acetylglucosamine oligosaccharide 3-O-carbamoyltransferase NolO n=1 Tax=Actinocorallia herbida TaxID=58109 RepID=A0A3N1CZZ0_9ACTN|nr:carbamoyltransferase C-terminal domain-containing protein [Actinocorallia herbida]ROO86847.1 beta-1,4-N-acetylglucosamine oligosaccharide 3-O-carbamoyltransferase NolO [Actinocorallia herbida]
MLTLGLSGNFSPEDSDLVPGLHWGEFHDSAACLIEDGVLLAAVEEERFNRIKKTTKFPAHAIRACLETAGRSIAEVDAVGYYFTEEFVDDSLNHLYLQNPQVPAVYARQLIGGWFEAEYGERLSRERLHFAPHHATHGMSAYARSGLAEALVVVVDGQGEEECITVYFGKDGRLKSLATYPSSKSLGYLYLFGTMQLGYGFGDEYKVMGLAPYGRPEVYREVFASLYTLGAEGDYDLRPSGPGQGALAPVLLAQGVPPRRSGEPITQAHMDLAAGLQETLETIVLHVLRHWADATGVRAAVLSGGVAHNSSLNGRILRSGLFDEVYVHPASHDAGSAEGAALFAEQTLTGAPLPKRRLRTADFGPALGTPDEIERRLEAWGGCVDVERCDDVVARAARLLADGAVLGWAQGRSEFGPRALGHRSILADPRPAGNQTRINSMIKNRESYRPFAPVVTAEDAHTYFDIPETAADHEFMSFVTPVREERREELGAVTHVDGTARLQVVDAEIGGRYYRLVAEFGALTGTPVLLNTSFNNNAEPIVQDIDDVLTCYLTTDLDYVVIEDFLIRRRSTPTAIDTLALRFRPTTRLVERRAPGQGTGNPVVHEISLDYIDGPSMTLSSELYDLLKRVTEPVPLSAFAADLTADLRAELHRLWQARLITLRPPAP